MLGLRLGLQLVLYGLQRVNVRIAVRITACVVWLGLQLVLYDLQRVNVMIAVRIAACVVWSSKN